MCNEVYLSEVVKFMVTKSLSNKLNQTSKKITVGYEIDYLATTMYV